MGENSKIEWTDHTFNPWTGCTKVSPGCQHCYAEGWAKRSGRVEWGPKGTRRRTSTANWKQPLKWDEAARQSGTRARVFCASLADVFEDHPSIDPLWRMDLWALIAATPFLDWLLLTKRPENIAAFLPPDWGAGWPNVWLGTTVENQAAADERIPHLLATPAAVRFLSCEPLLGPVDVLVYGPNFELVDWVIAGGESGPKARPCHPDWARGLRDQCAAANVPFLFKQWGEWKPDNDPIAEPTSTMRLILRDGTGHTGDVPPWPVGGELVFRVGKHAAGRTLDGVIHDGYPVR